MRLVRIVHPEAGETEVPESAVAQWRSSGWEVAEDDPAPADKPKTGESPAVEDTPPPAEKPNTDESPAGPGKPSGKPRRRTTNEGE